MYIICTYYYELVEYYILLVSQEKHTSGEAEKRRSGSQVSEP